MNNSKILLGVSGKAGAGKDEFSDIAVEQYGFVKIPFALEVKNEVNAFLQKYGIQFEYRNLWGTQADKAEVMKYPEGIDLGKFVEDCPPLYGKTDGLTFRLLLQLWGTDYRRAQDNDYWLKKALEAASMHDRVVISDVRFQNEFDAIRICGGSLIRINRESIVTTGVEHISETALDHIKRWNYSIANNTSLEDYRMSSKYVLDEIVGNNE